MRVSVVGTWIRWGALLWAVLAVVDTGPSGAATANLVSNGSFDGGMAPWWSYGAASESVASGAYCATVNASANIWDSGVGQGVVLQAGVAYQLSFFASGDPARLHLTVQNPTTYADYAVLEVFPTAAGAPYLVTFVASETITANLVFQASDGPGPRSFCIDDVALVGDVAPPVYKPDTGPRVRVNQVGYLPFGPKYATLVTAATAPVAWELRNAAGHRVARGRTRPSTGVDASSGLATHAVDFTEVSARGTGFTLLADGEASFPFTLGAQPYENLRVDSLRVFYTQRSGTPIDGTVAGAGYARPAGHVSAPGTGVPNQGDRGVPCQPADVSLPIYGVPWTCDYTLDVVGGWYDAGDHGKYVVNGGIAVHQLLDAFERAKRAPTADPRALGDGTLHVPEAGNNVPDILDEARYELEFFLKMVVPPGKPLAGMVHHKVHDSAWTGLPLAPDQDAMLRWLHRPSTAATLNLAATAAKGARLFARFDAAFSHRLLTAATRAWSAAQSHPDLFAPAADGASGGGAYEDSDTADELYWAAAELYLTTGKAEYLRAVLTSPVHTREVFTPDGFYWGQVAALGRLDLATVPSALPDRARVVESVVAAARRYLHDQADNAFGQPYSPSAGTYVWGSNSQILNNLVVLATAYDLTGDERFQRGVLAGFDYLLGRNALNMSYVTGYGTVFSHNQHSRLYSHQLNPSLPNPPVGTVAGGPNSVPSTWDPTAAGLFGATGCAPQFCYVDDIGSWSTNELAINWSSALAWVASFVADQDAGRSSSPKCDE